MLTIEGKIQICQHYDDIKKVDDISIEEFCSNHKLKKTTFFTNLQKYQKLKDTGVNEFHENKGRPPLLDDLAIGKLAQDLIEKRKAQKCQKKSGFRELIRKQIEECYASSGKANSNYKVHRYYVGEK